jgi:hypothetical protein
MAPTAIAHRHFIRIQSYNPTLMIPKVCGLPLAPAASSQNDSKSNPWYATLATTVRKYGSSDRDNLSPASAVSRQHARSSFSSVAFRHCMSICRWKPCRLTCIGNIHQNPLFGRHYLVRVRVFVDFKSTYLSADLPNLL